MSTTRTKLVCSAFSPLTSKNGNRTLGYTIDTTQEGPHQNRSVIRSEQALKSFHRKAVAALTKSGGHKNIEKSLNFPLKEYRTGLELLPSVFFFASWYVTHFHYDVDPIPAAGVSLALASVVMMFVFGVGLASFPTKWSAHKRLGPLTEYLNTVVNKLGENHELVLALLAQDTRPDWPSKFGAIDLDEHDLPHEECSTEWWYYNAHFQAQNVQGEVNDFSFFASFFRIVKHVDSQGNKYFGHALTWALVDVKRGEYHFDVVLDKDAPKDILKAMESSKKSGPSDPLLRRALMDVLKKGNVPLPDRLMSSPATCDANELNLNYDGNTLQKTNKGEYMLNCAMANGTRISLVFTPQKQPVRHGDMGIVKGHENENEDMFYYFIPRCALRGSLELPNSHEQWQILPAHAQGWYDHEFGGVAASKTDDAALGAVGTKDYAWNWVCIQLDQPKMEISAATLLDPRNGKILEIKAVVVDAQEQRLQFDGLKQEMTFEEDAKSKWTSVRTFRKYPLKYSLSIPSLDLKLSMDASDLPDQEFMTLLSKPAFWEGRVKVSGTMKGKPVTGLGFAERNGFDPDQNINTFFKNVGIAVRDSVEEMYPLEPTLEQAINLIATKETSHYCEGVPLDILGKTLIAPVRLIADRGGKSWRSYASLACVDAVGGDSRKFVQWVAMPEFLHVGSLIVDDIQDRSESRRGGPCAHLEFGEPLAINAGTAAYFQCEQLLAAPGLSEANQIKCYKLYFAALRGGHAGQALDIYGNDYLMDDVVKTGNAELLTTRILAIHRLKTAVPAGTLARMGCTVGGGSDAQIEAVGMFMEAIGVAFQIMDDVLNLRGIYANAADKNAGAMLKTLGEDIMDGKVTMPVAKYMGMEPSAEKRAYMWAKIQSKPQDQAEVNDLIAEMERVGAVQVCVDMSVNIVDEAWEKVDSVIPDSFAKLMLRSFGWYVTKN